MDRLETEQFIETPAIHPGASRLSSAAAVLLSNSQIISETLPALQQVKQQGLVKFIGITGLPLKSLQYILDRVPQGKSGFTDSIHAA